MINLIIPEKGWFGQPLYSTKITFIPHCFSSCPNFTSKTHACVLRLDSSVSWFLFLFFLFQTLPVILKTICAAGLSLNRTTLTGNANKEELLLFLQVHRVDKEIPVRLRQSFVRHRQFLYMTQNDYFVFVTYVYLIIILRGRTGCDVIDNQRGAQRRVGYNHFISSKPEYNNCFLKNCSISNSSMLILFLSKTEINSFRTKNR